MKPIVKPVLSPGLLLLIAATGNAFAGDFGDRIASRRERHGKRFDCRRNRRH